MEETVGVLMTYPMLSYLEEELSKRFHLFRLWHSPIPKLDFLRQNSHSIRAIVPNTIVGVDSEMLDALPSVEIVSTFSVGIDGIDLHKCRERGIKVTNTPDVLTDDVADLAIGLILSTLRKMCASDRFVRSGAWKEGDFELASKFSGRTVGIVGLGRIGLAIAVRAEAFGCSVSYCSRSKKPDTKYKYYSSAAELAANSQVLVIACPLTEDTHHMVNRGVMEALGPKGVLVNVARGSVVDEPELVSALLEGRLGGAGLDVFEHEPEPPEQLLVLDNVVLSSHVGSDTEETCRAMADLVLGNLEAHLLNKPLLTPVTGD